MLARLLALAIVFASLPAELRACPKNDRKPCCMKLKAPSPGKPLCHAGREAPLPPPMPCCVVRTSGEGATDSVPDRVRLERPDAPAAPGPKPGSELAPRPGDPLHAPPASLSLSPPPGARLALRI